MTRWLFTLVLSLALFGDAAETRPPNMVYIISDDQSWTDFGFMGNALVHTPNLDALAKKSARFPNGYLTCSVCRPSLATLLTGLYQHQHGIHFNHGPPGNSGYNRMKTREEYTQVRSREFELIKKVPTLPRLLAGKAGYRCLQTGKFWEGHWRNGGFTEGMTTFTVPPKEQTFGGVRKLASGIRVAHGNGDWGLKIGRETMQPIEDFITDCEKSNTPWMVWYAPYLPHQPHDSPEQFYKIIRNTPGVKKHQVPYFASIAQFDETVGRLVEFVENTSEATNTIFVFVCDNGWSASTKTERKRPQEYAHTRTSKRAPFDEGIRSPILIRWDKHVNPETRPELVSSIDIVPTLLKTAGVPPPSSLPGKDLLNPLPEDRAVFGAIYPGDATSLGNPSKDVAYHWIRQSDYKLILPQGTKPWGNHIAGPVMFNVKEDPTETQNLIGRTERRLIVNVLRRRLNEWYSP